VIATIPNGPNQTSVESNCFVKSRGPNCLVKSNDIESNLGGGRNRSSRVGRGGRRDDGGAAEDHRNDARLGDDDDSEAVDSASGDRREQASSRQRREAKVVAGGVLGEARSRGRGVPAAVAGSRSKVARARCGERGEGGGCGLGG
jgi:hypothetical protein